jgi:type I restriction enzyme M protein
VQLIDATTFWVPMRKSLGDKRREIPFDRAREILGILSALSERDDTASICRDKDGNPEPDPELRDTESVPLAQSVDAFFEREVKPHVPDAWIDTARRDEKNGEVGLVGYEINFNRYFYRYTPPRALEEIEADIRAIEKDIMRMLAEVTGNTPGSVDGEPV